MSLPTLPSTRPLLFASLLAGVTWIGVGLSPTSPFRLPRPPADLDPGVVLLFAPVCLLIMAIMALAFRLPHHGGTLHPIPIKTLAERQLSEPD